MVAAPALDSPDNNSSSLEFLLMHAFCLLVTLVSLGVLGWLVLFYRTFTVGTLFLILIDLVIGGLFGLLFAIAVLKGEVQQALGLASKRGKQ